MPPRLRGACSIFWLVWVTSLSFWLGAWTYQSNYAIQDDEMVFVEFIMFIVCLVSASLAFTGCCFLFCDITHFCCVLLYGIPLGLAVPVLCGMGLVSLNKVRLDAPDQIKAEVIHYWKVNGRSPVYMAQTERDMHCCGIFGPSDYRHFIYGRNCETQKLDVPYTCCNLTHLFGDTDGPKELSKKCHVLETESIFNIDNTCHSSTSIEDISRKCKCITNATKIAANFSYNVYQRGCVRYLLANTSSLMDVHLIFFIIFPLMSVTMAFIFFKSWYRSTPIMDHNLLHYKPERKSQLTTLTIVDESGVGKKSV